MQAAGVEIEAALNVCLLSLILQALVAEEEQEERDRLNAAGIKKGKAKAKGTYGPLVRGKPLTGNTVSSNRTLSMQHRVRVKASV